MEDGESLPATVLESHVPAQLAIRRPPYLLHGVRMAASYAHAKRIQLWKTWSVLALSCRRPCATQCLVGGGGVRSCRRADASDGVRPHGPPGVSWADSSATIDGRSAVAALPLGQVGAAHPSIDTPVCV
jgi:hypothetical protein